VGVYWTSTSSPRLRRTGRQFCTALSSNLPSRCGQWQFGAATPCAIPRGSVILANQSLSCGCELAFCWLRTEWRRSGEYLKRPVFRAQQGLLISHKLRSPSSSATFHVCSFPRLPPHPRLSNRSHPRASHAPYRLHVSHCGSHIISPSPVPLLFAPSTSPHFRLPYSVPPKISRTRSLANKPTKHHHPLPSPSCPCRCEDDVLTRSASLPF
jgi:hypothetical protein